MPEATHTRLIFRPRWNIFLREREIRHSSQIVYVLQRSLHPRSQQPQTFKIISCCIVNLNCKPFRFYFRAREIVGTLPSGQCRGMSLPKVGRFDDPCPPVPRIVMDAGIIPLTPQLLGNLGMVMMIVVLVHVTPKYGSYNIKLGVSIIPSNIGLESCCFWKIP